MSEPTGRGSVKTLAIRLTDELHTQLVLIASLERLSLTDTIRLAIEDLIERRRGDGDLQEHAAKVLEEMDQEAQVRRQALQALLGVRDEKPGPEETGDQLAAARTRSRKGEPAS
jgi:hypothetical protein